MQPQLHRWVICAGAAVWLALSPARATIAIDPLAWGLNPGDTFRIAIVTFGTTNATSTNIATYDSFVNSQGVSGITYNGAALSWQAIGLTPTSSPINDVSRYSSQANASLVFNLNGQIVSNTSSNPFWSGSTWHLHPISHTINGSGQLAASAYNFAWTGFDTDGSPASARDYGLNGDGYSSSLVYSSLGISTPYYDVVYNDDGDPIGTTPRTLHAGFGYIYAGANGWADIGSGNSLNDLYPMYAMSELITVIPEPAATAPLIGAMALAAGLLLRRVKSNPRPRPRSSRENETKFGSVR